MMPRKKMMSVFGAAVLAIGLTACGGSSTTTPATPEPPPPPPPPTDQETTAGAAAASAMAAKASADAAKASSDAAMAATENLATMQTNGMADTSADEAKSAAGMAMAEYEKAKAASDAAAAATLASVAGAEAAKAEAAAAAAAMYAETAAEKSDMAAEQAMMELMIDGKTKSVGESSLTIDERTSTPGAKVGHQTGLTPMDTIPAVVAQGGRVDDHNTPASEAVAHKQAVAARTVPIGVVYDSSDDMARLMLITKYGGSEMMGVYVEETTTRAGSKAGYLTIDDGDADTTDTNNTRLRSVGMHYEADETDGATANTLEAADSVTVTSDTRTREVFSFVDPADNTTKYVVLTGETTQDTDTSAYAYLEVDVMANFVGSNEAVTPTTAAQTAAQGGTRPAEERKVTAAIPMAMEYDHIHFGVWASLADEGTNKGNQIDDLGIGFVQNHDMSGMTSEMPNDGTASYDGNWVATVRSAGSRLINLEHGGATVTADFAKNTVKAALSGLATLSGDISGAEFSGTKATNVVHDDLHAPDAAFSGTFSGAFYGSAAAGSRWYLRLLRRHGEW